MKVVSHQLAPPEHLRGKDGLKLLAYVWWCGDDSCDCQEPVIAWQWRRPIAGSSLPAFEREAIWTGTFTTDGASDVDDPDPQEELLAECRRLGIVVEVEA